MKRKYLNLLITSVIILVLLPVSVYFLKEGESREEMKFEERPDHPVMTDEEQVLFDAYLNSRMKDRNSKAAPEWEKSTYANGRLTGQWKVKTPVSAYYGYRVDNSAYDSLNNVFYIVSYAGHIYKLEYENGINWTLLNHKVQLNPPDNGSANPVFHGTLLPDSTFRLIRSYDEEGRMEYSDDEGRNWTAASGASLSRSWSNQVFEISNDGQKRIVLHTYYSNYHHIYFSDDDGETYTEALSFPISTYDVRIVKPFYTNEAYLWVWGKSSKKIDVYKYDPGSKTFALTTNSSSTVEGTNLSNVAASYYEGQYHFYLTTINGDYTVYYSNDEGATWQQKNAGRDRPFEVMCPDKPNILISGFEDMKKTTDYGVNWTGYDHALGWDLQHMKTYEKAGGTPITLLGQDFGCYISETPEDKNSYTWCNVGASYAMHYDAVTSEHYSSIYMGNQDRGTTAYLDEEAEVHTVDVDGTDVLRVCFANYEQSAWSWFYYGRIKHRFNFPTNKGGEASFDGLGNWWAAPIIASPNPTEDAIYAAYGTNLEKYTYDAANNSIVHSTHPFDFKANYNYEIGGFGYSELNRDLWYVALENGTFLYSHDAGENWNKFSYIGLMPKANDQSYNYAKNQIVIKASQLDTNKVYYAGVGNFLLVSEDGGKKFTVKNRGLNVYRIRDFDLSPDEKYIFAACGYGGAWVYSVEENYWYQMSDDPIPSVDFTDVQFIKKKNCVRFSTYGSGIMDLTLDNRFTAVDAPEDLALSYEAGFVELNWSDISDNEDGFYVERASTGGFARIDTLPANITTFQDMDIEFGNVYYYQVKGFKNDSSSYASNMAVMNVPEEGFLYQGEWEIESVSSQEINGENAPAEYAIDNNPATFWHTQWQGGIPTHPHSLVIDLGSEKHIAGFRYLPRQDGNTNGTVEEYEIYVSNDPDNWGEAASRGQFDAGTGWKEDIFESAMDGRYVNFVALSEITGAPYASAAEIALLYQAVLPEPPTNLKASIVSETTVILNWNDNSMNEIGFVIEQGVDGNFEIVDSVDSPYTSFMHRDQEAQTTYEYRVSAYNTAGMSEVAGPVTITTQGTVGLEQFNNQLKIYPNPCETVLSVELTQPVFGARVRIISMDGRTVFAGSVNDETSYVSIDVTSITKGNYILELVTGMERYTMKFSKE